MAGDERSTLGKVIGDRCAFSMIARVGQRLMEIRELPCSPPPSRISFVDVLRSARSGSDFRAGGGSGGGDVAAAAAISSDTRTI